MWRDRLAELDMGREEFQSGGVEVGMGVFEKRVLRCGFNSRRSHFVGTGGGTGGTKAPQRELQDYSICRRCAELANRSATQNSESGSVASPSPSDWSSEKVRCWPSAKVGRISGLN